MRTAKATPEWVKVKEIVVERPCQSPDLNVVEPQWQDLRTATFNYQVEFCKEERTKRFDSLQADNRLWYGTCSSLLRIL